MNLKAFWTLFKNMYHQGPCSLRPCISMPYCRGVFTITKRFFSCIEIFSDTIICDCQTVNVISNRDGEGTYQRSGYVNGRTSWNSSTGHAVWYSQNYQGWFFGYMDYLGQDEAFLKTFWTGNNSCFYNISNDQWHYFDSSPGIWTYVNVGDVSIQCLSGNFE